MNLMLEKAVGAVRDNYAEDYQESDFVSIARAVLLAIREPDGDMLGAGDAVINHGCHGSTWQVMIDAILAQPSEGEG